jgi:hypothetical protein
MVLWISLAEYQEQKSRLKPVIRQITQSVPKILFQEIHLQPIPNIQHLEEIDKLTENLPVISDLIGHKKNPFIKTLLNLQFFIRFLSEKNSLLNKINEGTEKKSKNHRFLEFLQTIQNKITDKQQKYLQQKQIVNKIYCCLDPFLRKNDFCFIELQYHFMKINNILTIISNCDYTRELQQRIELFVETVENNGKYPNLLIHDIIEFLHHYVESLQ